LKGFTTIFFDNLVVAYFLGHAVYIYTVSKKLPCIFGITRRKLTDLKNKFWCTEYWRNFT